jgi:dienelactone hydrolase
MTRSVSSYIARPSTEKTDTAILYLTDIFGLPLVNNKLYACNRIRCYKRLTNTTSLGDSLAKAGYLVVMPDLFSGDVIPRDAMGATAPNFNMTAWRAKHNVSVVDAIVESTIKAMRTELGVKRIGAVGYCFGGKYVARFLALGKGLDAGFVAHPSGIETAELQAIANPISFAYPETDSANPPAARHNAEEVLLKKNATYQMTLYAGAEHG